MDKDIFTLLDYFFELRTRISDLIDPEMPMIFNRPHHGFDELELKKALLELSCSGYIIFTDYRDKSKKLATQNARDLEEDWFISLTNKGGVCWEKFYSPEWDKYLVIDIDMAAQSNIETASITCGSLEMIKMVLERIAGSASILHQTEIEAISPWCATYWKTIDQGYIVRIEGTENLSELVSRTFSTVRWKKENKES